MTVGELLGCRYACFWRVLHPTVLLLLQNNIYSQALTVRVAMTSTVYICCSCCCFCLCNFGEMEGKERSHGSDLQMCSIVLSFLDVDAFVNHSIQPNIPEFSRYYRQVSRESLIGHGRYQDNQPQSHFPSRHGRHDPYTQTICWNIEHWEAFSTMI
jgi:hypothetical protein